MVGKVGKVEEVEEVKIKTWTKSSIAEEIIEPILRDSGKILEWSLKPKSKNIISDILKVYIQAVVDRKPIMILKMGTIRTKAKNARAGRNPKTGEDAIITARNVVTLSRSGTGNKGCKGTRLTRQETSDYLVELHPDVGEKAIRKIIYAFQSLMSELVVGESRIEIRGFGSFNPRFCKAKTCRNPKTGEEVKVGDTYKIHFKAGRKLLKLVN